MKVNLHLICPPWSNPQFTSIQTGSLHAYVRNRFADRLEVRSYAAHVTVAFRMWGATINRAFGDLHLFGEYMSLLAYRRRFKVAKPGEEAAVIKAINAALRKRGAKTLLPASFAKDLVGELDDYIDEHLAPRLSAKALNVVGLTTNFDQIYAALYFTRALEERFPEHRFLFVLGGASITLPNVIPLLRRWDQSLLLVVGEGEGRLGRLLDHCLAAPDDTSIAALRAKIIEDVVGVLGNEEPRLEELARHNPYLRDQIDLSSLGIPAYGAYFDELRGVCDDEQTFDIVRQFTQVTLEGSRGCFAKCDFCGLNSTWNGFRTNKAENVVAAVEHLGAAHGVRTIRFVDNVCDTWAEAFAELLLERGSQYRFFMELRASHPEAFWTKLSLAGAFDIQVGVEALSDPLLDHIEKKTTTMHNLAATKYLAELGIQSTSNLMLCHPRSTIADVEETERVLRLTPHFPPYALTDFLLAPGSPLHRKWLETNTEPYDPRFQAVPSLPRGFERETLGWLRTPKSECPPDVVRAWKRFSKWFRVWTEETRGARLEVRRLDARTLLVHDRRTASRLYQLVDDEARIYADLHRPTNLSSLCARLKLRRDEVMPVVERFLADQLVIQVGDELLALALRPRDELVARVLRLNEPPKAEKRRLSLISAQS